MRLLLDTHVVLWWLADDARVGPVVRAAIEDEANDVLVSAASIWEVVVKIRADKWSFDLDRILGGLRQEDLLPLLPIRDTHLRALATLPMHHRDPFDHLLMAQAIAEDATFVSADRHAARYPVRLLSCSA